MNESVVFKKLYSKYSIFFILTSLVALLTFLREIYSGNRHKRGAEKACCALLCCCQLHLPVPPFTASLVAHGEGSTPESRTPLGDISVSTKNQFRCPKGSYHLLTPVPQGLISGLSLKYFDVPLLLWHFHETVFFPLFFTVSSLGIDDLLSRSSSLPVIGSPNITLTSFSSSGCCCSRPLSAVTCLLFVIHKGPNVEYYLGAWIIPSKHLLY